MSKVRVRAAWLAGVLPFAPFLVAVLAYVPLSAPGVVSLVGPWSIIEDDRQAAVITAADLQAHDASGGLQMSLPGPLVPGTKQLKLARTFMLEAKPTEPYVLVFGGLSNGVGDLWLNGHWIGSEGVFAEGYKLSHVGLGQYAVAPDLLLAGENLLVVAVGPEGMWESQPRTAAVDQRLLIGPQRLVRPWFDRVFILEHVLELGGAFLLLFVTALVLGLSLAERDQVARRVQWAAAGLCFAICAYLAGKSGMTRVISLQRDVLPFAVTCIALVMPELLERAFLGRTTRFVLVNRAVCGAHLVLQMFVMHSLVYVGFIPWLFVVMVWGLWLSIGGLRRSFNIENVLLSGSVVAMVTAGMNDLFTDLSLVATPRLFTLAAVDMAIIGSIFVVSRFLRTMGENARLIDDVERQNQELSKALDRAEESTRLKSSFLANTSHELRTPLNSIINVPEGLLEEFVQKPFVVCSSCSSLFEAPDGYVVTATMPCPECAATGTLSMELRAVFSGDPDAAMRYLRSIQQSGRHLLAVVNDILDFSKLEVGRMVVHLEDSPLDEVLERIEVAMAPLADTRRIHLKVDRVDATVRLDTDPVKLTQVLMNLVSNAIKFSPEDSDVVISAAVADDTITLAVTDHGIGIAVEDQARIFESFMQVDNSHTRKVGGTGLGLSITKKIVELMHGTLTVRSVPGQGSTFEVVVPRRQPSSSSSSSSSSPLSSSTTAA